MPKSRRIRAAAAALGLAAVFATIAAPAYAVLPTDPAQIDILVFSKSGLNDVAEEVALETASLQTTGAVVTGFDGGNGSDLAWSAALAGKDILVLPELEGGSPFYETGGTATVSTAAAAVITAWVNSGGVVIMNSSYTLAPDYGQILSAITGKDYASVLGRSDDSGAVWTLQGTFAGAPDPLLYADGGYALSQYGSWSADLKSIVQPVYASADGQELAVGIFTAGSGYVTFLAYDWFPDGTASVSDWNTVLRLVATGVIAPPAPVVVTPPVVVDTAAAPLLAATGSNSELPLLAGGLLLLAGLGVVLNRRRLVA